MDDFRTAWNSWDSYKRITALRDIKEPSILAFVSKNDPDWRVRRAAVENLTDQSMLADFAKNDAECGVRLTAAQKLDDKALAQEVFAALVDDMSNHKDVRTKACGRMDGGHKYLGCKCRRCGESKHVWEDSKDFSSQGIPSHCRVCRRCGARREKLSIW